MVAVRKNLGVVIQAVEEIRPVAASVARNEVPALWDIKSVIRQDILNGVRLNKCGFPWDDPNAKLSKSQVLQKFNSDDSAIDIYVCIDFPSS